MVAHGRLWENARAKKGFTLFLKYDISFCKMGWLQSAMFMINPKYSYSDSEFSTHLFIIVTPLEQHWKISEVEKFIKYIFKEIIAGHADPTILDYHYVKSA